MNLSVNTLLQGGKYKIVRFIKSGGFGCTYEAEHVMLEKRIAIKEFFVKDFCNRDEQTSHVTVGTQSKKELVAKLRRKFIDEAKGLCKLHHPGIVSVSDVFEENGTAYFVMDYIEGKSLSEIVHARGALPEKQALDYIRQAGEALQYVHEHNRLHLDIKPDNLMLDANGQVVLIDFGASKQYDEENGENTSTLIGKTPGYAPLEQMGNDVVRFMPATDVYALGATLYKLLTGTTPLSANRLASGEEQPPLPAGISQGSRMAVDRAMQTRKDKRPQSVREFLSLLGSLAEPSELENDNTVFEVKTEVFEKPQPEPVLPAPSKPELPKNVSDPTGKCDRNTPIGEWIYRIGNRPSVVNVLAILGILRCLAYCLVCIQSIFYYIFNYTLYELPDPLYDVFHFLDWFFVAEILLVIFFLVRLKSFTEKLARLLIIPLSLCLILMILFRFVESNSLIGLWAIIPYAGVAILGIKMSKQYHGELRVLGRAMGCIGFLTVISCALYFPSTYLWLGFLWALSLLDFVVKIYWISAMWRFMIKTNKS